MGFGDPLESSPHAPLDEDELPPWLRKKGIGKRGPGRPPGSFRSGAGLTTLVNPQVLLSDPDVERLVAQVLAGKLERARALYSYEPDKLTARHINVVLCKAVGISNKHICQMTGYSDRQVSVILGHPDAQVLLVKLVAKKAATAAGDVKQTLEQYAPDMLSIVRDIAEDEENKPEVRVKAAFGWLDRAGYSTTRKIEVKGEVGFSMPEKVAGRLLSALEESDSIEDVEFVEVPSASEAGSGSAAPGGPPSGGGTSLPVPAPSFEKNRQEEVA